ncbi:hypothetical protein ABBQ38_003435 [Trebouxia sp. C0009 RCD-2024]
MDEDMHEAESDQENHHDNSQQESMNTVKDAAMSGLMSMGQGAREKINLHNRITRGQSQVGTDAHDGANELCLSI